MAHILCTGTQQLNLKQEFCRGDPLDPLCFAPVLHKPVSIVDAEVTNDIKGQWLELDTSSWTPSVLYTDSHLDSLGTHITTCNVQGDATTV